MVEFRWLYPKYPQSAGTVGMSASGLVVEPVKPRLQYRFTYKITEHMSGDIMLTKIMAGDREPQWKDITWALEQ